MTVNSVQLPAGKQVEVFFDGDCPLCKREINWLKKLDRQRRVQFTDIATSNFVASDYRLTQQQFMAEIQGRLADGTWISGVEVFRQLYAAIGLGGLVWCTRLPGLKQLLEVSYRFFARYRLRLTGRCDSANCQIN